MSTQDKIRMMNEVDARNTANLAVYRHARNAAMVREMIEQGDAIDGRWYGDE